MELKKACMYTLIHCISGTYKQTSNNADGMIPPPAGEKTTEQSHNRYVTILQSCNKVLLSSKQGILKKKIGQRQR